MIEMKLNGLDVKAEEGWTILETCQFYGIEIPTLCYKDHLEPYGACRICTVEIGEGESTRLVSSLINMRTYRFWPMMVSKRRNSG